MITLRLRSYVEQAALWPKSGRHILAQFDADSIFVYQAYRSSIADYAVAHQRFGGDFSYNRMSWIKPNFLWMMYRSGWAAKEGQERILAVQLKRSFFDELLSRAVASTYHAHVFASHDAWKSAVEASEVRLQWDPDHGPSGQPLERRAVQLGLRGGELRRFGQEELIRIEDITDFVVAQRNYNRSPYTQLCTPEEAVYHPDNPAAAIRVGLDTL